MTAPPDIAVFKPVDILTLIALVAGPALAVGIQLWFERRREVRRTKISILDALMAYRGRLGHPDSVSAINRVELVFHDDNRVTGKLRALIEHMERERNLPEAEKQGGWDERSDLLTELIASAAESLGYKFSHNAIKRIAYLPQGMIDENEYTTEVRKHILTVVKGESPLLVSVKREDE
ncbi:MAG TPA: DUF6680 family protein [Acidobacteriaceae bacterium]